MTTGGPPQFETASSASLVENHHLLGGLLAVAEKSPNITLLTGHGVVEQSCAGL
jgi:hypothetical protein